MKALVLAAMIAASDLDTTTSKKRDSDRRGHAERNRFTEHELADMFGDMEPTPEPALRLAAPEPDAIGWDPEEVRTEPQIKLIAA